ncbi:alpha/beta fold hydrolase [Mycobacterium sp. TY814]|uniref:alpha/beta fold hydrolase n=1 Tax=unclassified Mycobacterium TaxID=2642494 RepID=UPI00274139E9|nr:alpha/beta fold hydrolase [Mycobacterium sp. TY814]MDP7721280.1 alpha/beta fold hydrolase [Mycobacterium sp. TY814]
MRSSEIRIREAKPKDYARVAAMHYPVWRRSWQGIVATHVLDMISTPKTWADTFYPTTLKRGGWQMWMAEARGKLLGMTLFGPDLSNPQHIQIDALYVVDESQRHGIGGMLLSKALRTYPNNDIILWAANKNEKARNFYEKHGFTLDERTYVWKPLPGVTVPHVGYRLYRSLGEEPLEQAAAPVEAPASIPAVVSLIAPPVTAPSTAPAASPIRPHPIEVPQAHLDDLRHRLSTARWPAEISGADWDYGTEQAFLKNVIDHWLHRYDWRGTEAEVNAAGSFLTEAAGQRVHFLHTRSARDDAIPLVITHGWPGSVVEFFDVLPLLQKRFHVVLVSMPGYGFSGPTKERGVDVAKVAAAVADVMAQLGYDRFLAQGGDWGALVTRHLGEHYPNHAVAIHTNMLFSPPDQNDQALLADVTEQEWAAIAAGVERVKDGTAYMEIQSTRPHSLGFGLDDSPLGLAGWILEKFHAWCDISDGMPISTDRLIDNLMFYWLTGTATSAARLYCESARAGTGPLSDWSGRVDVPTGYAVYPGEMLQTPRAWAAARYNLVHYTVHERGGHFAAFEQPQVFADDLTNYADVLVEKGVF